MKWASLGLKREAKAGEQIRVWMRSQGQGEKGDSPSFVDFSQAPRELVKRQQGRESVHQGLARVRG